MRPTPRLWATVGTGGVLLGLGLTAQTSRPLYAAAVLGAWVLVAAVTATQTFLRHDAALTVEYTLDSPTTFVETPVTATLALTRPDTHPPCSVTATCSLPPGLSTPADPYFNLSATETARDVSFEIEPPIVGSFSLPQPTLTLSGPFGLFTQTLSRGSTPSVDVTAKTPGALHVGQGGQSQLMAYGEHVADRAGPGVVLRELRQYQSGEPADRIDWKATARLGDPYVRETEAETDRQTALIVDHGGHMARGYDGETMVAAASNAALAIAQQAATVDDPIGLWTVGDAGLTTIIEPGTDSTTRRRIRQQLLELTATDTAADTVGRAPSVASRYADHLAADAPETAFAKTLRPYFAHSDPYVRRLREAPLVETVRRVQPYVGDGGLLVVVTSDHDRTGVREAVRVAVQGLAHVFVFVAPSVLYTNPEVTDTARYDAYVAFEDFRKQLAQHPRVTAFEIAPKTRIESLLATRQTEMEEGTGQYG